VGLGLLGFAWTDGDGMNRSDLNHSRNWGALSPSILEPEVPAGGIVVVIGAQRSSDPSGHLIRRPVPPVQPVLPNPETAAQGSPIVRVVRPGPLPSLQSVRRP
jgi:hypothetical protein